MPGAIRSISLGGEVFLRAQSQGAAGLDNCTALFTRRWRPLVTTAERNGYAEETLDRNDGPRACAGAPAGAESQLRLQQDRQLRGVQDVRDERWDQGRTATHR